jgi:SAM-dependent methyltransferase
MSMDSGSRLRSLYDGAGGVAGIFSPKVADYVSSRPDYPAALFETLEASCDLRPGSSVVADVGAGTGLLTEGLLRRGYSVVAIEPNAAMRQAADHFLLGFENYRSAEGSAERMPVESATVDLVTAAHAFHWFEVGAARAECLRVLRPGGKVALIWNDRSRPDRLHEALDKILDEYGGDKRSALRAHEERRNIPEFFGSATPEEYAWPHAQMLSEAGLLSLVFSRSYMPDRNSSEGDKALGRVLELYAEFSSPNGLQVRYTTVAYIGPPSARDRS